MERSQQLAMITAREFGYDPRPTLALLPIGATEQHGSNLVLGTDSIAAERIAQLVAHDYGNEAVVLPTLPYGFSEHHMAFPGTISISPDAMLAILRDIARSVARQGFKMLVFVNGHNGNTASLNVAAATIRYELGLRTAVMFYFKQASDVVREHAKTPRYGHAGEIETSVMLHLDPRTVRTNELVAGDMVPTKRKHADNMDPFALYVPIPFDQQTRNGSFGDARSASAETGSEIVRVAVERTVTALRSLVEDNGTHGSD